MDELRLLKEAQSSNVGGRPFGSFPELRVGDEAAMNESGRLTRVPFGQREADGQLIDVHDAARGAHCSCRCPSCRMPLIARQGDEKVWHFAHRTQGDEAIAEQACAYSFFVSVRLMARQLLAAGQTLALPAAVGQVSFEVPELGIRRERPYPITAGAVVVLNDVEIDPRRQGVTVDLSGRVRDAELLVVFSHPERAVADAVHALNGDRVGVLAVDLRPLAADFATARTRQLSYRDLLSRFLAQETASRHWLFHPREARMRARAMAELEAEIAAERWARARPVDCHCLFCGTRWREPAGVVHACRRCQTHLGTRVNAVGAGGTGGAPPPLALR